MLLCLYIIVFGGGPGIICAIHLSPNMTSRITAEKYFVLSEQNRWFLKRTDVSQLFWTMHNSEEFRDLGRSSSCCFQINLQLFSRVKGLFLTFLIINLRPLCEILHGVPV